MPTRPRESSVNLSTAVDNARTGDIWIFRGRSGPDRAIQTLSNSPVNHVGMAVVLDDMPPLMWHAELGKALQDMWTGRYQRGVQLHDLRASVQVWCGRYGQTPWFRQLEPEVTKEQENAVLRTIARLDGTPFPSTVKVASRWLGGKVNRTAAPVTNADLQTTYCAEVVGVTYESMGLLKKERRRDWYDPGRFWSGDRLPMMPGYSLGKEVAVVLTPEELKAGKNPPRPTTR
ncbi:MAG: hypothetical protein LLG14_18740 [Nocardiaceae bacterium]|nr:hypothetical protein [Nocardiaceae bacterium]